MLQIKLGGIESAALKILAEHEGIAPEHLLRDLIRDAAICMVTGNQRHSRNTINLAGQDEDEE